MKLNITEKEQKIFDMILECRPLDVTPRVAGGWVRDKIMGVNSTDLDIALENITGFEFASIMEKTYKNSVSSVNVIQSNPEKSKHLETAVCKINDLLVDFVNLRSEKYTDSRIPIIGICTPQEDAYRRDLTINSLFYNLVTKEVEDFTCKGIQDIKKRILRTPLDPYTTFSDDSLRILRLFRFKAKLDFSISEETIRSLHHADLKNHLKNKVSKERIYTEIFKMINYKFGYKGMYEIIKNGYSEPVFDIKLSLEDIQNYYSDLQEKSSYENRWIYNLYLVFLSSSCQLVKDTKKRIFLNVKICKDYLLCPTKTVNIIKSIEEGLYLCRFFNLNNLLVYNCYFVCILLGEYYLDILYLYSLKCREKHVKDFYFFIQKNYNSFTILKPKIEIKDLDKVLGIEKKYLNHFVQEIKIYQLAYPEGEVLQYIIDNKEKILEKYINLQIPYNAQSEI